MLFDRLALVGRPAVVSLGFSSEQLEEVYQHKMTDLIIARLVLLLDLCLFSIIDVVISLRYLLGYDQWKRMLCKISRRTNI